MRWLVSDRIAHFGTNERSVVVSMDAPGQPMLLEGREAIAWSLIAAGVTRDDLCAGARLIADVDLDQEWLDECIATFERLGWIY